MCPKAVIAALRTVEAINTHKLIQSLNRAVESAQAGGCSASEDPFAGAARACGCGFYSAGLCSDWSCFSSLGTMVEATAECGRSATIPRHLRRSWPPTFVVHIFPLGLYLGLRFGRSQKRRSTSRRSDSPTRFSSRAARGCPRWQQLCSIHILWNSVEE
jgi:hypothetical protein